MQILHLRESTKRKSLSLSCDFLRAMVSVLAFYSNNPCSNPAEAYSFFNKMLENNENKQKEAGVGTFKCCSYKHPWI